MSNCVSIKITSQNLGSGLSGTFFKIVVTRCQILGLKCTNIDFRWGSATDRLEELTAPHPLAEIKGKGKGADKVRGREKGRHERGREIKRPPSVSLNLNLP